MRSSMADSLPPSWSESLAVCMRALPGLEVVAEVGEAWVEGELVQMASRGGSGRKKEASVF